MNRAWRSGLAAVGKTAVLVAGVPLALWRLWLIAPLPRHLGSPGALRSASAWSHLVVLCVAVIWLWASFDLLRQIATALRRHEPVGSSWSSRWAVAIAGLVFLATTQSFLGGGRAPAPLSATSSLPVGSPARPGSTAGRGEPGTTTVRPGECLADVAARVLGCPDDWPLIARSNFSVPQPGGAAMLDPVQVRAGWRLVVPPTDRPPGNGRGGTAPTGRLAELALLGLGTVATCALLRRLRQLRRVGDATRRPGERRGAQREARRAEAALSPFSEAPLIDWLEIANRLLWRAVREGAELPLPLRLVRVGPDGVEFLFALAGQPAPWPFVSRGEGQWWVLEPTRDLAELENLAAECDRFEPALIPLGDDGAASYLLPVGPGRRLALAGDDQAVDAAMLAIVAGLRAAPWADELSVELVGIDPPPPEEQCYSLAASNAPTVARLAEDRPTRAPLDARWRREPLIVVARNSLLPSERTAIESANEIAGMIVADERGTEVLAVSGGDAVLHPFGLALSGATPGSAQLSLIEKLFVAARRQPALVPLTPGPEGETLETLPEPGPIEVLVLCAIPEVRGLSEQPFARDADRVVELLAYLALHGGRASIEEVGAALFPRAASPERARIENLAAAARAALGGQPGPPLLRHLADELVLDAAVTCDWIRAKRALRASRSAEPERAVRLLDEALGLVAGAPLSGIIVGYLWWSAESFDEDVGAELVDGADRLAALALAGGDAQLARLAIEKGRLADPDSELLGRAEMAVCDVEGDREGVRSAYAALESALRRLGGGEPSPETRALFETLDGERARGRR